MSHQKRKAHGIVRDDLDRRGPQCRCGRHNCRWAGYATPFKWKGLSDPEWRRQSWGRRARRQGQRHAKRLWIEVDGTAHGLVPGADRSAG